MDEGLSIRAVPFYVVAHRFAYDANNEACPGCMPTVVARQAGQIPFVALFWYMVRLRAICARLCVVAVPLLSGAGLKVLVSQLVVPRQGLSPPDCIALVGRGGRVIGIGRRRGYRSGWDPGRVMFAYASLLGRVARIRAYLVVPSLLDSQSHDQLRFSDWPFAPGWVGHTRYG